MDTFTFKCTTSSNSFISLTRFFSFSKKKISIFWFLKHYTSLLPSFSTDDQGSNFTRKTQVLKCKPGIFGHPNLFTNKWHLLLSSSIILQWRKCSLAEKYQFFHLCFRSQNYFPSQVL